MTEAETTPGKSRALRGALWILVILLSGGTIAAVISISLLRSRRNTVAMRAHLEINSVGSMRAYAEAQAMFHSERFQRGGTLGYATPYTLLKSHLDGSGQSIDLIDTAFAAAEGPGAPPKHGYVFLDMKTIGGEPINWVDDFALCGTPARYGKTGCRTFIVKTGGTVWGKDLGESRLLTDFPNDIESQGWKKVEAERD